MLSFRLIDEDGWLTAAANDKHMPCQPRRNVSNTLINRAKLFAVPGRCGCGRVSRRVSVKKSDRRVGIRGHDMPAAGGAGRSCRPPLTGHLTLGGEERWRGQTCKSNPTRPAETVRPGPAVLVRGPTFGCPVGRSWPSAAAGRCKKIRQGPGLWSGVALSDLGVMRSSDSHPRCTAFAPGG